MSVYYKTFSFEASQETQFAIHVVGLHLPDLYSAQSTSVKSLEKLRELILLQEKQSKSLMTAMLR